MTKYAYITMKLEQLELGKLDSHILVCFGMKHSIIAVKDYQVNSAD